MVGKLVRINRASIGVPKGTLGLVVKKMKGAVWEGEEDLPAPVLYTVLLCGHKHERRYLIQDLEIMEVVEV
jgi:hypothetical protein